jgi:cellobiose-specific phosphotransferase system component IIA
MKKIKPTLKQKTALKKTLENIANRNPKTMGEIMIDSGYSVATAHNPEKNLISKKAWKELIEEVDKKEIRDTFTEIMREKGDNRNRITAAVELSKMLGLYPKEQTDIEQGEINIVVKHAS